MSSPVPGNAWHPEIATPQIVIRGFEELGLPIDGGRLARWLIDHSSPIEFPSTDPSTRVDDNIRESKIWYMRYAGPNIFSDQGASSEVLALSALYREAMPRIWAEEFGIPAKPLGSAERAAEAFITNPNRGEGADPHSDTRLTTAGYPTPGAGLIVSHCTNARDVSDIRAQPSTLVLPQAGSLIFFNGTRHPHMGIDFQIEGSDDADARRTKYLVARRQFNVVSTVRNLYEKDRFGPSASDRGPSSIPNHLRRLIEDRVVLSLNFDDGSGSSSLDNILMSSAA